MSSGPSSPFPTARSSPSIYSPDSLQRDDVTETLGHVNVKNVVDDHQHSRASLSSPNRSLSTEFQRALTMIRRRSSKSSAHTDNREPLYDGVTPTLLHGGWYQVYSNGSSSNDVGGPRFPNSSSLRQPDGRTAGEPSVYDGETVRIKLVSFLILSDIVSRTLLHGLTT